MITGYVLSLAFSDKLCLHLASVLPESHIPMTKDISIFGGQTETRVFLGTKFTVLNSVARGGRKGRYDRMI